MTQLTKPVKRESNTTTKQGRPLMLEIRPGATDVLVVREKGRRKGYAVPIEKIFELGARLEADYNRKIRTIEKNRKKKGVKNDTKNHIQHFEDEFVSTTTQPLGTRFIGNRTYPER